MKYELVALFCLFMMSANSESILAWILWELLWGALFIACLWMGGEEDD